MKRIVDDPPPGPVLLTGPAFLSVLFDENLEAQTENASFLLPPVLRRLVSKATEDVGARKDLVKLIKTFDPQFAKKGIHQYNWDLFFQRFANSKGWKFDFIPEEEIDDGVREQVEAVFNDPELSTFEVTLSPRRNLLGAVFGELLGCSRRTGRFILFKSTKWLKYVQDRLPVVLAAAKNRTVHNLSTGAERTATLARGCDALLQAKEGFVAARLKFPGSKSSKFVVGLAISAAGVFAPSTMLTIGGIVFALIDP